MIVDRAALEAISEAGRNAEDAIIRDYAESVVAIADIKNGPLIFRHCQEFFSVLYSVLADKRKKILLKPVVDNG